MTEDEFNKLTDTGKYKAVRRHEIVLDSLRRLFLSAVRLLFSPDEIIDAAMRWSERDAKEANK